MITIGYPMMGFATSPGLAAVFFFSKPSKLDEPDAESRFRCPPDVVTQCFYKHP